MNSRISFLSILIVAVVLQQSCSSKKTIDHPLFEVLDSKRTGLEFTNKLTYNQNFNLFKYIYFYNGSGLGAGDFNNDGLIDLFFGSNQQQNRLYLNMGNLKFRDITAAAHIPNDGGWTTGISVVDINNDGLLDIYVCRVGNYGILQSKNLLLVNQGVVNGIPTFKDEAHEYGLDFSGFSTQAAFFDYDNDGDLDMFLLNHSVHENGTFRPRADFQGTYHPLSGDRIFRNDGNHFTDVTKETGINSTAIGYGLGIAIADINLDGYPDIYIGNDFHENDYLYINQKNGTFKEVGEQQLMHTSQFSMGVDVADVNNDGYPEIVTMDMLPSDPYILKRSLGEDTYDVFNYKINSGYSHQYTRNNLQYNRRNGMFSEVGLYSEVAATDWSWAPLWVDFDNDGLKDLFVSNGIPKRMNDIDYINFISNGEIQKQIRENNMSEKDISLIDKFPEIKIQNKFFRNKGNLVFEDQAKKIQSDQPTFSNGAIYADLDNDGDLDIVVNNLETPALLYENKTNPPPGSSLEIELKGPKENINAIGSRLLVFSNGQTRSYEKYPARGFMSSMEIPLHVGLINTRTDSILLVWPDHSYTHLQIIKGQRRMTVEYSKGLPVFDFSILTKQYINSTFPAEDLTKESGLSYVHKENHFVEFDREPLIPHMFSTEGPALAVADINKDGLEDVFIGGARDQAAAIFLQQPTGKFIRSLQPALQEDSSYEDVAACWADINNDGSPDLVVASGGNEFYGTDPHNTPRIYLNDGKGHFRKMENPFSSLYITASSVVPYDFNGDGFIDLFIGGRTVPWEYGQPPRSYLLQNDGHGKFKDVTVSLAKQLTNIGFVTNAIWFDIDNDGDKDLVLSLEWGGIVAFMNNQGVFTRKELTNKKGWWNFILPVDINGDGRIDLVCGNLGLNSRLKASPAQPVRMYYNDFDGNGKKEQLLTYYVNGKEIPFATKAELEKQMPVLKKKFLYAADFAKAKLTELFDEDKLNTADTYHADYFSNCVLINHGNLHFEPVALPWEAQLSTYKDAVVVNANNDSLPDILLAGNYYDNNVEMGRYDADFGTLLINKGKGIFRCEPLNGLTIKGQVRHIQPINIKGYKAYVLARNNDSAMLLRFNER
jgi:enediyne biosynthesis protein E4